MKRLNAFIANRRKNDRWQAGFTLAEMLIVIGIIAVLAGFGFVNVIRYQKDLRLQEYDDIARQIFIAAQNQLTTYDAAGRWNYKDAKEKGSVTGFGEPVDSYRALAIDPNVEGEVGEDCYYFTNTEVNGSTVFGTMILPFGSIDETIRTGGNYVVTYDALSGTILSVAYSGDGTFDAEKANTAFTDAKTTRRNKDPMIGCYGYGQAAFVEGEAVERPVVSIENAEALVLHIVDNPTMVSIGQGPPSSSYAEKIHVSFTGSISGPDKAGKIIIERKVIDQGIPVTTISFEEGNAGSGIIKTTTENKPAFTYKADNVQENGPIHYTIYLDRITKADEHFANLFPGLIPGEDITVTVYFEKEVGGVLSESKKVTATANSLFRNIEEQFSTGSNPKLEGYKAYVANGRHLQNLSEEVSHTGYTSGTSTPAQKPVEINTTSLKTFVPIKTVELVEDIHWSWTNPPDSAAPSSPYDFLGRVKEYYYLGNSGNVSVYKYDSSISVSEKFFGMENTTLASFIGNKHRLAGFDIVPNSSEAGDAGLFASATDMTISYLFVTNTNVQAGTLTGNAGTLVGLAKNVTLQNCGVYYENYKSVVADGVEQIVNAEDSGTSTSNAWKEPSEVSGSTPPTPTPCVNAPGGSAGGLIGAVLDEGATIGNTIKVGNPETEVNTGCFAAVRVQGLNAGGLIGEAAANIEIENSYSGGRVKEFEKSITSNPAATLKEYLYSKGSEEEYFNITSTVMDDAAGEKDYAAGGLVGNISRIPSEPKVQITNCYATSSVGASKSNNVWIGGLVGLDEYDSSSYRNDYAAGLVDYITDKSAIDPGTGKAVIKSGAFAGKMSVSSGGAFTDNWYLDGINVGMDGVAESSGPITGLSSKTAETLGNLLNDNTRVSSTRAYTQPVNDNPYPLLTVNTTSPDFKYYTKDPESGNYTVTSENPTGNTHFGDWQKSYLYHAVTTVNGNQLTAKVTIPGADNPSDVDDIITLSILGELSSSLAFGEASGKTIPLFEVVLRRKPGDDSVLQILPKNQTVPTDSVYGSYTRDAGNGYTYWIVLDDIAWLSDDSVDRSFKKTTEGSGLIPGENICVFARNGWIQTVQTTDNARRRLSLKLQGVMDGSAGATSLTGTTDQRAAITNSLFGYHTKKDGISDKSELTTFTVNKSGNPASYNLELNAKIYSFRHLENLSNEVSSVPSADSAITGTPVSIITKAVQTRDLIWMGGEGSPDKPEEESDEPVDAYVDSIKVLNELGEDEEVKIRYSTETGTVKTDGNFYYPVSNESLVSYDGGNHMIQDTRIKDAGSGAGIFASFAPTTGSSNDYMIKDLILKNTYVANSAATKAGTLAGETTDTEVSNVLVYADRDKYGDGSAEIGVHNTVASGNPDTGGLIGAMTGGKVMGCASAVAVHSEMGNVGGLIGSVNGGTVISSYSGGHTIDGKYKNVKDSADKIIYNVQAGKSGTAGGLIGVAGGQSSISNSYSTCSVSGATKTGGFIGETQNSKEIKNCYATGLVPSTSTAGAFAGSVANTSLSDNQYVADVTPDIKALAGASNDTTGVTAIDVLPLAITNKSNRAYRYDVITKSDSTLMVNPYALEEYPFTSVHDFTITEGNVSKTYPHIGDWEDGYEHVLVVNNPAS